MNEQCKLQNKKMYIWELIITYIKKWQKKCYWIDNTQNKIKKWRKNKMYTKDKYK